MKVGGRQYRGGRSSNTNRRWRIRRNRKIERKKDEIGIDTEENG